MLINFSNQDNVISERKGAEKMGGKDAVNKIGWVMLETNQASAQHLFYSFYLGEFPQQPSFNAGAERHSGHRAGDACAGQLHFYEAVVGNADELDIAAVYLQIGTNGIKG